MRNYSISRLKHLGKIGTSKRGRDENGFPVTKFIPEFSCWYGTYQTSVDVATNLLSEKVTRTIAVRHNPKIKAKKLFQDAKGENFIILGVQADDQINALDILSLGVVDDTTSNSSSDNSSDNSGGYSSRYSGGEYD